MTSVPASGTGIRVSSICTPCPLLFVYILFTLLDLRIPAILAMPMQHDGSVYQRREERETITVKSVSKTLQWSGYELRYSRHDNCDDQDCQHHHALSDFRIVVRGEYQERAGEKDFVDLEAEVQPWFQNAVALEHHLQRFKDESDEAEDQEEDVDAGEVLAVLARSRGRPLTLVYNRMCLRHPS